MAASLKWVLSHALGYTTLGMFEQARQELDQLGEGLRRQPDVLVVELEYAHACRDWPHLASHARSLTEINPQDPAGWISLAYATRRTCTIEEARDILLRAEQLHPDEPTIQFNLGCYAAQCEELDIAEAYVRNAISLNAAFKKMAREDEDLEPLREAGISFG